jgi:hypothetical protein
MLATAFFVVFPTLNFLALACVDIFGIWPGSKLAWPENVHALMTWSQALILAPVVGLIWYTVLLIFAARRAQLAWVVLSGLLTMASLPINWYFRWYDAFGVGV